MYFITSTMENLLPIIENISTYTLLIYSYFLYSTPDNTLGLSQLWSSASPATKKNVTRIGFWSLTICLCLSLTVCLLVTLFCCHFPFVPCSGSPLRNSFAWPRACCMSAELKLELRHLGNVSFISAIVSTWNTKQAGRGGVERETTDYSRLLHGKVPWTNQTVERQNGQNSWAKYASWPWQFLGFVIGQRGVCAMHVNSSI